MYLLRDIAFFYEIAVSCKIQFNSKERLLEECFHHKVEKKNQIGLKISVKFYIGQPSYSGVFKLESTHKRCNWYQ